METVLKPSYSQIALITFFFFHQVWELHWKVLDAFDAFALSHVALRRVVERERERNQVSAMILITFQDFS